MWRTFLLGTVALVLTANMAPPAIGEDPIPVVVCSTTQIADFTRQVVGDRWRVDCILGPQQDPHTYTPTAGDAKKASQADLCLANGWHLEGNQWMENLARDNGKTVVHCVSKVQPLPIPGEQAGANDPHAWFNPENAAKYVDTICDAVSQHDPPHAMEYMARANLYKRELKALDAWIKDQVKQIQPPERRILITSHDAFQYFCHRYGFTSASPLSWSTAELGGGTPARRAEAANAIRKSGVRAIFVETSVPSALIDEIVRETGVAKGGKLYSDAMGAADSAGGTYIGMMRENVITIVHGLRSSP